MPDFRRKAMKKHSYLTMDLAPFGTSKGMESAIDDSNPFWKATARTAPAALLVSVLTEVLKKNINGRNTANSGKNIALNTILGSFLGGGWMSIVAKNQLKEILKNKGMSIQKESAIKLAAQTILEKRAAGLPSKRLGQGLDWYFVTRHMDYNNPFRNSILPTKRMNIARPGATASRSMPMRSSSMPSGMTNGIASGSASRSLQRSNIMSRLSAALPFMRNRPSVAGSIGTTPTRPGTAATQPAAAVTTGTSRPTALNLPGARRK
jgi:hypothetical protein